MKSDMFVKIMLVIVSLLLLVNIIVGHVEPAISQGLGGTAITCSSNGSMVYVVTGDKLHISIDGGSRWDTHQIFSNNIR